MKRIEKRFIRSDNKIKHEELKISPFCNKDPKLHTILPLCFSYPFLFVIVMCYSSGNNVLLFPLFFLIWSVENIMKKSSPNLWVIENLVKTYVRDVGWD